MKLTNEEIVYKILENEYGIKESEIKTFARIITIKTRTNNNASTYLATDYEVTTFEDVELIEISHEEIEEAREQYEA